MASLADPVGKMDSWAVGGAKCAERRSQTGAIRLCDLSPHGPVSQAKTETGSAQTREPSERHALHVPSLWAGAAGGSMA